MVSDGTSADQNESGYNGAHVDLHRLRLRLQEILGSIYAFESPIRLPPVLDASLAGDDPSRVGGSRTAAETAIPGLRGLEESVRRDLDVLTKFLDDPRNETLPPLSTNAPYLVAVWDEVLTAPPPVVGIWSTFPDPGGRSTLGDDVTETGSKKRKAQDIKVDIVADGGLLWIRVNTIKNSKILGEFREIDSYLTDSDDEESGPAQHPTRPSQNKPELDNSVIRMGRSLISAARLASASIPPLLNDESTTTTASSASHDPTSRIRVAVRLTRLDPSPSNPSHFDPRIPQTIKSLENMGLQVKLGEANPHSSTPLPPPPRVFLPTMKVNLDLSLLVALISDITHVPLPKSRKDAEDRFIPPASYVEWKKKRMEEVILQESSEDDLDETGSGTESGGGRLKKKVKLPGQGKPESIKHSRALANQAKQEMESAILEEMHDRLLRTARLVHGSALNLGDVEFWTTAEARTRCLRIASKISGTKEKERAKALLFSPTLATAGSSESGTEPEAGLKAASALYWGNSRYREGYIPLPPVRIFPQTQGDTPDSCDRSSPLPRSPFFDRLVRACTHILAQDIVPHPRSLPPNITSSIPAWPSLNLSSPSGMDTPELEGLSLLDDDGGEIQRATVTKANPKLTAHTVETLLEGAKRGWTTLTANKHSVKEILKEVKTLSGGYHGAGVGSNGIQEDGREIRDEEGNVVEIAAIWVTDPRSLAEIMSADYVPPTPPLASGELP